MVWANERAAAVIERMRGRCTAGPDLSGWVVDHEDGLSYVVLVVDRAVGYGTDHPGR